MPSSIYAHPGDNIASGATWTLPVGTVDANYPLANIYNGNPLFGLQLTDNAARLVADFGSSTQIQAISIHGHNLDAALDVRAQKHTADVWTSPDVDVAVTVGAVANDGLHPDIFCDLSATSNKRYFSLLIPTNTDDIVIGEIWIWSQIRTLPRPLSVPVQDDDAQATVMLQTSFGVEHAFSRGPRRRAISGEISSTNASDAAVLAWHRACYGMARPTVFILDPTVPDVMHARFTSDTLPRRRVAYGLSRIVLSLRETARGVVA